MRAEQLAVEWALLVCGSEGPAMVSGAWGMLACLSITAGHQTPHVLCTDHAC